MPPTRVGNSTHSDWAIPNSLVQNNLQHRHKNSASLDE